MELPTNFPEEPFEGDLTLELQGLPSDAQVVRGTATLTPKVFGERISLPESPPYPWGVTKDANAVDFHARRIVSQVQVASTTSDTVHVQIDMGGVWVPLNNDGTMHVPDDEKSPDFDVSNGMVNTRNVVTSRIQVTQNNSPLLIQAVTWLSFPTNVSLRIGEQGPFWFQTGELRAQVTTPDFGEPLRAYLLDAQVENGHFVVPFTLHSDAIAQLEVKLEIEYVRRQAVLPTGVKDVLLPFAYEPLPQADSNLLTVALPTNAQVLPGKTTARVVGSFEPSRIVLGPTRPVSPSAVVSVSSASQAQPISVPTDRTANAVDLLLESLTQTATVNVTLLGDADGKPWGESLLPRPATVRLDQEINAGLGWVSAPLPTEFQFKARKPNGRPRRYWLVVNSAEGEVSWAVRPQADDPVGLYRSQDGGLSWQATEVKRLPGAVAGLFRLRHTPAQFEVPIQLQVGEGEKAQLVSLDRFQPLGRVDFTLDFPKVAEAFDQYLAEAAPPPCPEGEHLANGDLEDWMAVGDKIMEPHLIPLNASPTAVVVSPDGCWVYVGGEADEEWYLQVIQVACHTLDAKILLKASSSPNAVAVHPDGTRAYVVTGNQYLHLIDTTTRQELGDAPVALRGGVASLALTPDGRRLYVTEYFYPGGDMEGAVWAIDTEGMKGAVRAIDTELLGEVIQGDLTLDEAIIDTVDFGFRQDPTSLAVAPDGSRLYVVIINHDESDRGEIHIIDVATHMSLDSLILEEGTAPTDIALTPDGRRAVIANAGNGTVSIIATVPRAAVESTVPVGTEPVAVAISPDGARAFVANRGESTASVIDLARRAVVDRIEVGDWPVDIAVTPQGDRIYVARNTESRALICIPVGAQVPAEWTVSGWVTPICWPDPFHLVAVLGPLDDKAIRQPLPTALSQVVPVTASCRYDFSFRGLCAQPGTVAEVIWLGQDCTSQRIDEVPIQVWGRPPKTRLLSAVAIPTGTHPPQLAFHCARLTAPEGTTQAEVRFRVPAGGIAAIDEASLIATTEAVANGDLRLQRESWPVNWILSPEAAVGVSLVPTDKGFQLQNAGVEPVMLVQQVDVPANQPFTLEFQGRAKARPGQAVPRVELRWLTADGSPTGAGIIQSIAPIGPDRYLVEVTVPTGATQVEVRLVVPTGTTLEVVRVSMRSREFITIPLTFLAQAPGELMVSDIHVAYDLVDPLPPPVPSTGLCRPTPPGQIPGEGPKDRCCCFCPCCETEQEVKDATPAVTPAGRPAVVGTCEACGTELVCLCGPLVAEARTIPAARRITRGPVLPTPRPIAREVTVQPTVAPPPRSPLADKPLAIVAGVGDRFSDILGSLPTPVTTVAELAVLDPEAEVEGISRERRLELKTKGEMIAAITVEAAPFATLADEPLETLLALPPADLARRAGQPTARTEQLQRDLRALRLLLKNDAFRSLRLSDLMPADERMATGN